ncbi:MAG: cupin domain-containing protein [Candidatus Atribacteria bacterium]|nr:cupin domain-containing protein [Candidatus Atribacteria bacterium]
MATIKRRNLFDVEPEKGKNTFSDILEKVGSSVVRDTIMLLQSDETESGQINVGFTTVYPLCSTRGHEHAPMEEVYFITSGKGIMEIDGEKLEAESGDVVYIPFGKFHRTENPYHLPLSYVWVTIKKEGSA